VIQVNNKVKLISNLTNISNIVMYYLFY